jgi:hypothetical protein
LGNMYSSMGTTFTGSPTAWPETANHQNGPIHHRPSGWAHQGDIYLD